MIRIAVFTRADSRMPMMRRPVRRRQIASAGTLKIAVTEEPSGSITSLPGGPVQRAGRLTPISWNRASAYPDQPTATEEELSEYSRIRSQPRSEEHTSELQSH